MAGKAWSQEHEAVCSQGCLKLLVLLPPPPECGIIGLPPASLSIPSCFPSCSGLSYHPLGDRVYSQCRSRGVIAPGDRDARILVPLGAWDELHGPW